jgi:hypothetical protein
MPSAARVLERVLRGRSNQNIAFTDLYNLLQRLGFTERIRGDHHIFTNQGVREILNLQPLRDGKAKPYQIKQTRTVLKAYGLTQIP